MANCGYNAEGRLAAAAEMKRQEARVETAGCSAVILCESHELTHKRHGCRVQRQQKHVVISAG